MVIPMSVPVFMDELLSLTGWYSITKGYSCNHDWYVFSKTLLQH